jgi:small subunit ribosomal protein S8
MTMTDPIADMLTRIRNANSALLPYTDVPSSKMKLEMLRLLKETFFIENYNSLEDTKQGTIRVYLKYGKAKSKAIIGIRRISKPGLRKYVDSNNIPRLRGGLGMALLSTSKGILTDAQAREQKIGGEVLCYIW